MTLAHDSWPRLRDRWLLASLVVPLVVLPWSFDAAELPKLTFLRLVALGLIVTGLFTVSRSAWASAHESKISRIHPLRLPIMLLLTLLGASALRSRDTAASLAALVDYGMLAFYAFSFTGAARGERFQDQAARTLTIVGAACAAWAIAQLFVHDPLNGAAGRLGRPQGPFVDPAVLGGYLASVFPVSLAWTVSGKGSARQGLATTLLIAVGLAAPALRIPLLAAGVGGLIVLAARRAGGLRRPGADGMALAACALLLAGSLFARSTALTAGAASELRQAALRMVREKPWTGWGPGAFGLVAPAFTASEAVAFHEPNSAPTNDPDNQALSLLAAGGWPGLAAFLWVAAGAGTLLLKRLRTREPGASPVSSRDAALAAGWAGLMAAWLIQSWASPPSIALLAPFWCVLGMASTRAEADEGLSMERWPWPVRCAGVAIVLYLLVPLPGPELHDLAHGGLSARTRVVFDSPLMAGPGSAVRWLVSDLAYRRAVDARNARDWDGALAAHLSSLKWAPGRIDNWLGLGDTAYQAYQFSTHRPFDWIQFAQIGYYRAQRLQRSNGFAYYGEGRLLTLACQHGMKESYADARKDYERAILLYPDLSTIHNDYGRLEESAGHRDVALREYHTAAALGSSAGAAAARRLMRAAG